MIDPTRLYTALLNTGLQQKDNALYQVIHDLIGNLALISKETSVVSGGGGSSSNSIINNNLIQFLDSGLCFGEDGQNGVPGLRGIQGLQGLQGIKGIDGIDGDDGFQGTPGIPGTIGATGASGIQGLIGIPGLDGSDGEDLLVRGISSNLDVYGNFSVNTLQLFVLSSTGKVGLGKVDPGAQLVIASNQANSSTYYWLTFRNLSVVSRGTWSFAKQSDNDLSLMYGIDTDVPAVGTLMYFKYSGALVGIAQTSPVSKLDINGNLTIGSYSGVTAAPANGMIISGFVGIRTSAPLAPLNVLSNGPSDQELTQQWGYGLTNNTTYNLKLKQTVTAGVVQWTFDQTNNSTAYADVLTLDRGRIGVGLVAPTAKLHIVAGAAGASLAPLKFTSGTNLTTAEAGAIEYNGTNLFFTRSGTVRENVLVAVDNAAAPATSIGVAIVNFYGANATNYLGDPNRWLSVNILGTVYKIPLYT